ncbi:hypothetical protein RQP53_02880 [Paucibacter sp. APW11]|uniref:Uncharacterized protein n=1 Tax=Roseateles aquae TaxID=3077235 RepID=A0ABU3P6L9_9BURK|nr:hypothetical protein [Paucibacter sp. APW11]MDT8998215.1 hypothetical protein [Paucibacter sp. APW11]
MTPLAAPQHADGGAARTSLPAAEMAYRPASAGAEPRSAWADSPRQQQQSAQLARFSPAATAPGADQRQGAPGPLGTIAQQGQHNSVLSKPGAAAGTASALRSGAVVQRGGGKGIAKKDAPPAPDDASLFGDGPAWAEVRGVEAESAARARHATDEAVHDHWTGMFWSAVPSFRILDPEADDGDVADLDQSMLAIYVRDTIVDKLDAACNTAVQLEGFRLDFVTGLVTIATIRLGPMLVKGGGRSVLSGGASINGVEAEFTLADLWRAYRKQAMQSAVTIRFTSIHFPRLQIAADKADQADKAAKAAQTSEASPATAKHESASSGASAPVKLPDTSSDTAAMPAPVRPSEPTATEKPDAPASSAAQAPPSAAVVLSVLDSLKLGFHVDAVELQVFQQQGDDLLLGVLVRSGALRLQAGGALRDALLPLTKAKTVTLDGQDVEPAALRAKIETGALRGGLFASMRSWDPQKIAAMREKYLRPLQQALADAGLTPAQTHDIQAAIEFLQGNAKAFKEHEVRKQAQASASAAAEEEARPEQRRLARERAEQLGLTRPSRDAPVLSSLTVEDIHAAVVGANTSRSGETRARLAIGRIRGRQLGRETATDTVGIGAIDIERIEARLLHQQLGLQIGGVMASELRYGSGGKADDPLAGDVLGIDRLSLGRSAASVRVSEPSRLDRSTLHAQAHLGTLEARGIGIKRGDTALLAQQASVSGADLAATRQGGQQGLSARGLGLDVRDLTAASQGQVLSVNALNLAPSAAHLERDTAASSGKAGAKAGTSTVVRGETGALSLGGVLLEDPQAHSQASISALSLGAAEITGRQDNAGREADLSLQGLASVADDVGLARPGMSARVKRVHAGPVEARLGSSALGSSVELGLERAGLRGLSAGQTGAKGLPPSSLDISEASLGGVKAIALDNIALAGLEHIDVRGVDLRKHSPLPGPPGTEQRWQQQTLAARAGQIRLDRLELDTAMGGDEAAPDRRGLTLAGLGLADAHLQRRTRSDRLSYKMQKAIAARDKAIANAEQQRAIARRQADDQLKAALAQIDHDEQVKQAAPGPSQAGKAQALPARAAVVAPSPADKLRAKARANHEQALAAALKSCETAKQAAAAAFAKREQVLAKREREGVEKRKAGVHKQQGSDVDVGALTLSSIAAELSGFEAGRPAVEHIDVGTLEARGAALHKAGEGDDSSLTVEVQRMLLELDEAQNGAVLLSLRTGKDMLENLLGDKSGATANFIGGVDNTQLDVRVGVIGGFVDLASAAASFGKDTSWRTKKLIEKLLKGLHVGGDIARDKRAAAHEQPHLHIVSGVEFQLEQLGLERLHKAQKKVFVGRKAIGEKSQGGVHLKHLLESGLQAAIDQAIVGPGTEAARVPASDGSPSAEAALGLRQLGGASVRGLDVRDVHLATQSGSQPGRVPSQALHLGVGRARLGEVGVSAERVAPLQQLLQTLGRAMLGEKPPPKTPAEAPRKGPSDADLPAAKVPASSATGASSGPVAAAPTKQDTPLDALFKAFEALLGGGKAHGGAGSRGAARADDLPQVRRFAGADGHALGVSDTTGDGSCGIHAMLGVPVWNPELQRMEYRHADPAGKRRDIATVLRAHDARYLAAYTEHLTTILKDIWSKVARARANGQADDANFDIHDRLLWAGLRRVDGVEAALGRAEQDEERGAPALVEGVRAAIDRYVAGMRAASADYDAARLALADALIASNAPADADLRGRLQAAVGNAGRIALLRAEPAATLRRAVNNHVDHVRAAVRAAPAIHADEAAHRALEDVPVAPYRAVVVARRNALLDAYAGIVENAGYYLAPPDLAVLADLEHRQLVLYRQSHAAPGQYEEIMRHGHAGDPLTPIFHGGAHYERAQRH